MAAPLELAESTDATALSWSRNGFRSSGATACAAAAADELRRLCIGRVL